MFDREAAIKRIEGKHCPCPGCNGGLTDPTLSPGGWCFCRSCRCAWRVDRHRMDEQRYAVSIHATGCPYSGGQPLR